jgi:hypothetical protein
VKWEKLLALYGSVERVSNCKHSKIKVTEGYSFDQAGVWVPHVILECIFCHKGIAQFKKQPDGLPSLDEMALKLVYVFRFDPERDKYSIDDLHDLR